MIAAAALESLLIGSSGIMEDHKEIFQVWPGLSTTRTRYANLMGWHLAYATGTAEALEAHGVTPTSYAR